MVDSTDIERFDESRNELFNIVSGPTFPFQVPIFIIANKMDKDSAVTLAQIQKSFHLENLKQLHSGVVLIFPVVATTGQGLDEVFEKAVLYGNPKKLNTNEILPDDDNIIDTTNNNSTIYFR